MNAVFPNLWLACATCMGNPDDPNVIAASWAVIFMLGVLAAAFLMFFMMVKKMVTSSRACSVECAPWDEMVPARVVATSPPSRPLHPLVPAAARPVSKARQTESVR